MPGLKEIMISTPNESNKQKDLRASSIEAIGYILESVKEKPEVMKADAIEVTTYLVELLNSGKLDNADP